MRMSESDYDRAASAHRRIIAASLAGMLLLVLMLCGLFKYHSELDAWSGWRIAVGSFLSIGRPGGWFVFC